MARRKTPLDREEQKKRNAAKRTKGGYIPVREVLLRNAREKEAEGKRTAAENTYYQVLEEIRAEYGGEFLERYSTLKPIDRDRGLKMFDDVTAATKHLAELPREQQTPIVLAEAAAKISLMNQGWIDSGWLVPDDKLQPFAVPTARVFKDGTVRAVNRITDADMVEFGKRLRERLR